MKFVRDEQDWGTYSNFIEEYSSLVVKKILSTCLYYNVDLSSRIFNCFVEIYKKWYILSLANIVLWVGAAEAAYHRDA